MCHLRWSLLVVLAVCPGISAAGPQDWQTVWLPEGALQLQMPPDWRLSADRSGSEAVLDSPRGERVLVRLWKAARDLTAAEALAQYQATLLAASDESSVPTPVTSADGRPGLLITGAWPVSAQGPPITACAVYAAGPQGLALALRCVPERRAAARQEYFDALVASARLPQALAPQPETPLPVIRPPVAAPAVTPAVPVGATSPAAPDPASPAGSAAPLSPVTGLSPSGATPVTSSSPPGLASPGGGLQSAAPPTTLPAAPEPPATPTPAVPPAAAEPVPVPTTPPTPAPPEVPEPPPTTFLPPPPRTLSVAGFVVPDNEGWRASVSQGTLWVVDPGGASGYFLWPGRVPAGMKASDLLAVWSQQASMKLALVESRQTAGGTLLTANLEGPPPRRAIILVWRSGERALLLGFYAPVAGWREQAVQLSRWLGQVTSSGWHQTVPDFSLPTETWVGDQQMLSLALPAGWQAQGGARRLPKVGLQISLNARGEDYQFAWQQPATPFFRQLTPILVSLGEQEGNTFRETDGEDYLRILNRRTPAEYVLYLLQQPSAGLQNGQIVSVEPSEALAEMLPGADPQGAVVRVSGTHNTEPRERLYLVATASLPLSAGAFRWQGAYCYLDYPAGESAAAHACLRTLLGSARPVSATGEIAGVLTAYAEPLRQALKSILLPETALTAPISLLEAGYEPAGQESVQFSVAAGLEAWRGLLCEPAGLPEVGDI